MVILGKDVATMLTLPYDRWVREHTEIISQTEVAHQHDCPICLERYMAERPVRIIGIAGCNHVIGAKCLLEILKRPDTVEKKCPLCRTTWIPARAPQIASPMRAQTVRSNTGRTWYARAATRAITPVEREPSVTAESFAAFQRDIADIRARASNTQRPRHERRRSEISRPVGMTTRQPVEPPRIQKDLPALPNLSISPPAYTPSPDIRLQDGNQFDWETRLSRRETSLNGRERRMEDRERALKEKEKKIQEMQKRHAVEQQHLAKRQAEELAKLMDSAI